MTHYVIGEPEYETSNWYRHILDGLISEKRQRRLSLTILTDVQALQALHPGDEDVVFIIGTNSQWLDSIIDLCEERFSNRCIVLGNHNRRLCGRAYSIVTADIARDVRTLYGYLESMGNRRIALYGFNPESTSDAFKKESFLSCGGKEEDIFPNLGSLAQCFSAFQSKQDSLNAVICVNDYCAISLLRHLGRERTIPITSCCGTPLSGYFRPNITGMRICYDSFGKSGLELSRLLQRDTHIHAVNIFLGSTFCSGETTGHIPLSHASIRRDTTASKTPDQFYSDPEVEEMLRIEGLLSNCDPEDLEILYRILAGQTYPQIAEAMFLSTNGVKYKVKSLCLKCGVPNRRGLVRLLENYLVNPIIPTCHNSR